MAIWPSLLGTIPRAREPGSEPVKQRAAILQECAWQPCAAVGNWRRRFAPLLKRIIARLIGFDGAYHRFTGKVTIEKFERDVRVERFDDRAIWELMYFGKARDLRD